MSDKPWRNWIPGALNKEQIKALKDRYLIGCKGDVDHSSIDLTLSGFCYLMKQGSVKPTGQKYKEIIENPNLCEQFEPDKEGIFKLDSKKTYVFKLNEKLEYLAELKEALFHGQATAKSTIGRVDVLARLIVDGMDFYEGFNPYGLDKSNGDMYLEVTPITFDVRVRKDMSLSQLRFFYDDPKNSEISGDVLFKNLIIGKDNPNESLSVDLSPVKIAGQDVSAFKAKYDCSKDSPIDLWERETIDPDSYWSFEKCDANNRLIIEKDKFYILRSKEKISIPQGICVYCRAIDETIGEMRIHYAGFAHPLFGKRKEGSPQGTPLIFEVRGHNVDVNLNNNEKLARLFFYRMSQPCKEEYDEKGKYMDQTLQLSNVFKAWQ